MAIYYVNLYERDTRYFATYSLPSRYGAGFLANVRDVAVSKIAEMTKAAKEVTIQSNPDPHDIKEGARKVPEIDLEVIIGGLKEKAPMVRFLKG